FRSFLFAARREHGAGEDAARVGEGGRRALVQGDGAAGAGERQRLPQTNDTGPANRDGLLSGRHQSPSATPSRRGSAPPSSPSGVTAMMCSPLVSSIRRTS